MDVGILLRDARERQGLTLDDLMAATRLSRSILEHIEQNRFDRLPGGILTKGHLRAYASAVGLAPEHIVADYNRQCFGGGVEELPFQPPPPVEPESRVPRLWAAEFAVLATACALYWAYQRSPGAPAAPPILDGRSWAGSAELISLDAGPRRGIRIVIGANGPCWVSATADGELVVHRMLTRGQTVAAEARHNLVLRIGAPEALVYWLNGTAGRRLGEAGRPVTVEITEGNVETFLAVPGDKTDAHGA